MALHDQAIDDFTLPSMRRLQPLIQRSWARCLSEHRLDPRHIAKPHVLTPAEVQDEVAPIDELIALASPEIRRLFNRLAGGGYLVTLASATGVKVLYRCDHDLVGMMEALGVSPGALWSEQSQGTNGIGTCVQTGEAISVISTDHFNASLSQLTCSVAPVFGPGGQLQCVINATTNRRTDQDAQRVVRGILVRSAHRIENTHFAKRYGAIRMLRLADDNDFLDLASEVRMAIDDADRIVDVTSNIWHLLCLKRQEIVGRHFCDVFPSDRSVEHYASPKALSPGVGRRSNVFALLQTPQRRPSPSSRAGATGRTEQKATLGKDPLHRAVFYDHPLLASRIPALVRGVTLGASLLISAEAGAGKEAFARMLYAMSDRAHLDAVRCSLNAPEQLMAMLSKPSAPDTVLLLEDVETLPEHLQRWLLRLLSDLESPDPRAGYSARPGTTIIATTGLNAEELAASRALTDEFLMFLGGIGIVLPPLRDYPNVGPILEKVIAAELHLLNMTNISISPDVQAALEAHIWPGNLMELRRLARHIAAHCGDGNVEMDHLPEIYRRNDAHGSGPSTSGRNRDTLTLLAALRHNDWNATRTARYLGISRATLYRKMARSNIQRPPH